MHERAQDILKPIRDLAWKAQLRIRARHRRLAATGKPKKFLSPVVV